MTELEILNRAKLYIDKMANGKNPITDEDADDNDIINNVRVSRCLFYVSGILEKVIANGGEVGVKIKTKKPFYINPKELEKYQYSEIPLSLSEIAKIINALSSSVDMKKLTYSNLAELLSSHGYLEEYVTHYGRTRKRPTEQGLRSGIIYDKRVGVDGNPYEVIVYDTYAQKIVVQLLSQTMQN